MNWIVKCDIIFQDEEDKVSGSIQPNSADGVTDPGMDFKLAKYVYILKEKKLGPILQLLESEVWIGNWNWQDGKMGRVVMQEICIQ